MAQLLGPAELRAKTLDLRKNILPALVAAATIEMARPDTEMCDSASFVALQALVGKTNVIVSQARSTERGY
mgnify:CR=1 FL=1